MRLHVEGAGSPDGDPVLFLHGIMGSSATFRWLEPDGVRAVRMDFRGHGASARAPGTYRLEHYVDDAVSVLEELGRPVSLAGHSLGGVVAWTVAQRRPELVTAAFLEDPPLYMGEPSEHAASDAVPVAREVRDLIGRWQREGIEEAAAVEFLASQPFGPDPARTIGEAYAADATTARASAWLALDVELIDPMIDGSLLAAADTTSPVSVPVFVLASDAELSAFPPAHEARLGRTHPDVEVVRLGGATHTIHDEIAHRPAYERQLTAFVRSARAT